MSAKRKYSRRSQLKKKPVVDYYVTKYVTEGPEREDFYQGGGPKKTYFSDLSEAKLFRSSESAQRTALALDKRSPLGPNSNVVLKARIGANSKVKVMEQ